MTDQKPLNQEADSFDSGFNEKEDKNEKVEQRKGSEGIEPGGQPHDSGHGAEQAGSELERGFEEHEGEDAQGPGSQEGPVVKPEDSYPKPEATVDWKAKAEAAEKRVADNQAAFTRSQQELSETRKKLEEREKAAAKPEEAADLQFPEEVQSFFNDFPEAKVAIEKLSDHLASKKVKEALGDVDISSFKGVQEAAFEMQWTNAVVRGYYDKDGNFVSGVSDYFEITAPSNKAYWDWYASKGYAACQPPEAISRLKEWKTLKEVDRVAADAAEKDRKSRERARQIDQVASAGLPNSQRRPAAEPSVDENDFTGGFDEG